MASRGYRYLVPRFWNDGLSFGLADVTLGGFSLDAFEKYRYTD